MDEADVVAIHLMAENDDVVPFVSMAIDGVNFSKRLSNSNDEPLVFSAARAGCAAVFSFLWRSGQSSFAPYVTPDGRTVLHYAAVGGNDDITRLILGHAQDHFGINYPVFVALKDIHGHDARTIAAQHGHFALAIRLQDLLSILFPSPIPLQIADSQSSSAPGSSSNSPASTSSSSIQAYDMDVIDQGVIQPAPPPASTKANECSICISHGVVPCPKDTPHHRRNSHYYRKYLCPICLVTRASRSSFEFHLSSAHWIPRLAGAEIAKICENYFRPVFTNVDYSSENLRALNLSQKSARPIPSSIMGLSHLGYRSLCERYFPSQVWAQMVKID